MQLTRHFNSREFRCPDGTPTPSEWLRWCDRLCTDYLEPLRSHFGVVVITSGFRSDGYNAQVGGAPLSFHRHIPQRRGAAADLRCARGRPADWAAMLNRAGIPGLGLYSTHVHADNRGYRARW